MKLYFEAKVKGSVDEIKSKFNRELFLQLKPPFMTLELERFDGCNVGDEIHLKMGIPGLLQSWVSKITSAHSDSQGWVFVDEGITLPFPLKYWRHEHRVSKISDSTSLISDSIAYHCGNDFLSSVLWGFLWLSFSIRPGIYRKQFGHGF